jgi:hypothetical protein
MTGIVMMQRILRGLFIVGLCLYCDKAIFAQDYANKRVFILHSYDDEYTWTHSLNEAIKSVLSSSSVQSIIFYMNTKEYSSETDKLAVARMAKLQIDKFKPDVVITSDDNAVKYVLMPYYKNSTIPFVFCGINWDASVYGLPYKNATGMLEIGLVSEIVKNLQEHAKGTRIGYLAMEGFTERRVAEYYGRHLGRPLEKSYFPNSFSEWKENFLSLQQEVDLLLLMSPKGIKDFDMQQAQNFVETNIKIPVGATLSWMAPMSLLGIVLRPEEQGAWAAQTALKIRGGQLPSNIPITRNREGTLFINMKIAKKLGITFKSSLLKVAKILR